MEPKQTFSQREIAWRTRAALRAARTKYSTTEAATAHVARQCIKTKTPSGLPMSIDFEHQTKRNLEFLVAAHKDLVERIDPQRPGAEGDRGGVGRAGCRRPSSCGGRAHRGGQAASRQAGCDRVAAQGNREQAGLVLRGFVSDVVRPSWHAFFSLVRCVFTKHSYPSTVRARPAPTHFFRFGIAIFFTVHASGAEHTAPRLTPLTAHTPATRRSTRSTSPATAWYPPSSGGRSRARRSRGSRAST